MTKNLQCKFFIKERSALEHLKSEMRLQTCYQNRTQDKYNCSKSILHTNMTAAP